MGTNHANISGVEVNNTERSTQEYSNGETESTTLFNETPTIGGYANLSSKNPSTYGSDVAVINRSLTYKEVDFLYNGGVRPFSVSCTHAAPVSDSDYLETQY